MECQACHICIGPEFMEHQLYDIGNGWKVCSTCLRDLEKWGSLPLDERRWLLPNGEIRKGGKP